ncbi:hypothetical protein BKH42_05485 [Helicobacter sp. 13S00482-2]|uniref:glycosyltransferase family 25 protein n=1 Tax=Helicobacter sp. 13S00482-2 TaxID=1476200 RepID=UPI000BD85840|nr:glycosyltransferase family 25 protein [Helicobacter sp. 13S00482-2]PAF53501.1 hypothetical protein BKH42_05485 [Helicobacter sp. 13S00482-2]
MKIFIINLARALDRREFMQKQIDKFEHLDFIFFNAIDAKNGEHHTFESFYKKSLAIVNGGRELKESERACYASHFSLWQKCIELNEPIVILEDDIELLPEFELGLARICDCSYDYVRLVATDAPKKPFINIDSHFALSYDELAGAQGYYITPKAAEKFIKGSKYWVLPVDNYMDRISMTGVKTILHIPFLIKGDNEIGDNTTILHRYDKNLKKFLIWKIFREFYRFFIQIKQNIYIFLCKKGLL